MRATSLLVLVATCDAGWTNNCKGPVQTDLRYGMSAVKPPAALPVLDPTETVTQAICCDLNFRGYAETPGTFSLPSVDLFAKMNPEGQETTFYDPVCGIPLFIVPRGRSLEAFKNETTEHGWPSFRDEEVVAGNVLNETGGPGMVSKCGTHLGDNLPEGGANRYCLDLACVSGNPAKEYQ